ncbi:elongation factor P hydroxylase, partial [Serratia bockelmannii]|nr:elongation factor P hydroxylase [Serratia bockelmannii]
MSTEHHYQQLVDIFDGCFVEDFQTRLIKGAD